MKRPIKNTNDPQFLESLMGLGRGSAQKSYYPQLQNKINELKNTNILLSGILQSASEISIIATDIDGMITFFSTGAEKMLGYTAEEMVHKETPLKIHDPEEVRVKAEFLTRSLVKEVKGFKVFVAKSEIEGSDSSEWTYIRKDGSRLTVSLVVTKMLDSQGKLEGFLGIAKDITERKKTELELFDLRNFLVDMINSMPSVIIAVDNELNVTHWNIKAEEYTRIKKSDAVGREFSLIFPYQLFDSNLIAESIKAGQVKLISKHRDFRNGKKVYEDVTIYPLSTEDLSGAVIRIDDVTEKVMFEELVVQNEKMMSVGGLAAGMAHEINNPLAGMMQTAQVLHKRLSSNKPTNYEAARKAGTTMEAVWEYLKERNVFTQLDMINDAGQRIAKTIENMLSFARQEEAELHENDIISLLDKTIDIAAKDYNLKKHYDFKHIIINKNYSSDLPSIKCEASKLQQVFLNILKNGAQAMFELTSVDNSKSPEFNISAYFEEKYIVIEFEDNGPGISSQNLKKVFEPFFTTKSNGKGTGLGLSVSYFIVTDTHNGVMTVDSELGKGTKFTIKLPI